MSGHAYTEDQLVEQPAIGLFAEQSALPNPQPGLSATLLPVGEGPGDEGAQLALPSEAITAGGLIEWLTAGCRKSLISSRFLFE